MLTTIYKFGSSEMWDKVRELANQHSYMKGIERTVERVNSTGEVFTPTELIIELISQKDLEGFAPGKTVLDPACGDGQFLTIALGIKMFHFDMSKEDALKDIYGVDIMRDNADLAKKRLNGGNIIMGNPLKPSIKLSEQTEEEFNLMKEWFA